MYLGSGYTGSAKLRPGLGFGYVLIQKNQYRIYI